MSKPKQIALPFQRHSATSKEAAIAAEGSAGSLRRQVWSFLMERGASGATDEEIQTLEDIPANTERPRRRELEQAGLVRDSGRTRLTASGRKAVVWVVVEGKQTEAA